MKVKRERVLTCRVSENLMGKIEVEAERQHRSVAGLIYALLLTTFDREPHGKEA